jgi:hypothetical protein
MPQVLTTTTTVTCGHSPPGSPATPGTVAVRSSAKLRVGAPVLQEPGIVLMQVSGCPLPANVQCHRVVTVTKGRAKLRVGGLPVMLSSLTGTTDGTPPDRLAAPVGATGLSCVEAP